MRRLLRERRTQVQRLQSRELRFTTTQLRTVTMTETLNHTLPKTLPDRLSTNPDSPFHDAKVLEREVGIRFNGVEKTNVEEYCVSEGWVRVAAGKARDRKGNALTIKLKGTVEPYFRAVTEGDAQGA